MAARQPSRGPTTGPLGIDRPKPKPKKKRGYGKASEGRTRKAKGGAGSNYETKKTTRGSWMGLKNVPQDELLAQTSLLEHRVGKKSDPLYSPNTGFPKNPLHGVPVPKKAKKAKKPKREPGGYATGGRVPPPINDPWRNKPKPKKQRGYGQASDGRTRKAHGGSVSSRLSKAGPVAKPN